MAAIDTSANKTAILTQLKWSLPRKVRTPIYAMLPERIDEYWGRIRPLLERVVKTDTGHSIESVLHDLRLGYTQLWVIGDFDGITVTRIQYRPTEQVLWNEWMAGDNQPEWVEDWFTVQKAYAQSCGCTAVEFNGRIGYKRFEKLFPDCKPIRTLYRQELT